ncbi:MAG: metal-sensing transcriptional repressor [bacterium]
MDNKEINNRLNRIEGQIVGISKMVQVGEKDVLSVIQQVMALKSALEKVGVLLLIEDLKNGGQDGAKLEKIFDYLIKLS